MLSSKNETIPHDVSVSNNLRVPDNFHPDDPEWERIIVRNRKLRQEVKELIEAGSEYSIPQAL
jgi:hypothetical protein